MILMVNDEVVKDLKQQKLNGIDSKMVDEMVEWDVDEFDEIDEFVVGVVGSLNHFQ